MDLKIVFLIFILIGCLSARDYRDTRDYNRDYRDDASTDYNDDRVQRGQYARSYHGQPPVYSNNGGSYRWFR